MGELICRRPTYVYVVRWIYTDPLDPVTVGVCRTLESAKTLAADHRFDRSPRPAGVLRWVKATLRIDDADAEWIGREPGDDAPASYDVSRWPLN